MNEWNLENGNIWNLKRNGWLKYYPISVFPVKTMFLINIFAHRAKSQESLLK